MLVGRRIDALASSAAASPMMERQIAVTTTAARINAPPPFNRLLMTVVRCGDGFMEC
jgi:hypothetical protein